MTQSTVLNDHLKLLEIQKTVEEKQQTQEQLLLEWEEISLELESFE